MVLERLRWWRRAPDQPTKYGPSEAQLLAAYGHLRKDLRPTKEVYICQCGRRYTTEGAFCSTCRDNTEKIKAFPMPNFTIITENEIECGRCDHHIRIRARPYLGDRSRVSHGSKCAKCGSRLLKVGLVCRKRNSVARWEDLGESAEKERVRNLEEKIGRFHLEESRAARWDKK